MPKHNWRARLSFCNKKMLHVLILFVRVRAGLATPKWRPRSRFFLHFPKWAVFAWVSVNSRSRCSHLHWNALVQNQIHSDAKTQTRPVLQDWPTPRTDPPPASWGGGQCVGLNLAPPFQHTKICLQCERYPFCEKVIGHSWKKCFFCELGKQFVFKKEGLHSYLWWSYFCGGSRCQGAGQSFYTCVPGASKGDWTATKIRGFMWSMSSLPHFNEYRGWCQRSPVFSVFVQNILGWQGWVASWRNFCDARLYPGEVLMWGKCSQPRNR